MDSESSPSVAKHEPRRVPSELPDPEHRWFLARSLNRIVKNRVRPSLYEERLVLIDAPGAAEALALARAEAKEYPLKGSKSMGVFDLGWVCPGLESARGVELGHFTYRSSERVNKFVDKRFESKVWHSRHRQHDEKTTKHELKTTDENHRVVVVRSLHYSDRLRFAGGRAGRIWIERFTAYNTDSIDEALEWAEADNNLYDEELGLHTFPLWEGFLPFNPLEDKAELFSIIRQSRKSPRRFRAQIVSRNTM